MAGDPELQRRFGKRCRALRQRKKLSLMDVVKRSHLQKFERGVLDVRLSTAAKLAEAYDVTLSALLRDVD